MQAGSKQVDRPAQWELLQGLARTQTPTQVGRSPSLRDGTTAYIYVRKTLSEVLDRGLTEIRSSRILGLRCGPQVYKVSSAVQLTRLSIALSDPPSSPIPTTTRQCPQGHQGNIWRSRWMPGPQAISRHIRRMRVGVVADGEGGGGGHWRRAGANLGG